MRFCVYCRKDFEPDITHLMCNSCFADAAKKLAKTVREIKEELEKKERKNDHR